MRLAPPLLLAACLGGLLLGCGGAPTQRAVHLRGDEALVVRAGHLQAVPLDGGPPQDLAETSASWCAADSRAHTVYLLEKETGSQRRRLRMVDLDGDQRPVTVIRGLPKADLMLIEHEGFGLLNEPVAVSHRIAAVLRLGPQPRVVARLGCQGDDRWLCEEGIIGKTLVMKQSVLRTKARIEALQPENVETLQAVFARGGDRPFWRPRPPSPALPRVRVPLEACADRAKCEVATPIPGTRYWLVVATNEPTGIYGRTLSWRQLFDPRTGEFFKPAEPGKRSRTPLDPSARINRMIVAPSGRAFMEYGQVVDFERGVLADGALPCGFADGGWIVGGWPFN